MLVSECYLTEQWFEWYWFCLMYSCMPNEPCFHASKHRAQLCYKILRSNHEQKDSESCLNICTASMFACIACCMCIEVCKIRWMKSRVSSYDTNNIFSCNVLFLTRVQINKSLTLGVSDCSRVVPCKTLNKTLWSDDSWFPSLVALNLFELICLCTKFENSFIKKLETNSTWILPMTSPVLNENH